MAIDEAVMKIRLDASQAYPELQALRSNISGVFGTAQADAHGAASGLADFAGAATYTYAHMRHGLERMGSFANTAYATATDPNIAHTPHYGMVQAQSHFSQEMGAYIHGPAGVTSMTPPGVGAGDYSRMLATRGMDRLSEAKQGFIRGALPVTASFGAMAIGGKLGSMAASKYALGLTGISAFALPVAGSLAAGYAVQELVEQGMAQGDRIFQERQELGELATAGTSHGIADQFQFGRGFRDMSKRMGISTQETGDIVATIRAMGMSPDTSNVKQALGQFENMAKDIREIAVGMQTSIANAARSLKDVERLGLGQGSGGVFAANQMAAGLGTSLRGLVAYAGQGSSIGGQTGIGYGAGTSLWMQSAFAGATGMGGLTGEEGAMAGGALGLGRAFGMGALRNAMGPYGEMQLMSMMGSSGAQAMPGSMMGTLNQAAGNMLSGDPIANMIELTTNKNRMLRSMGGRGMRMMQGQAIQTEAKMLQQMSPGLTEQRALQYVGMQRFGYNEIQARGMARSIQRGFRARRPDRRVEGLPGIFGDARTAQASARATDDSTIRRIQAEETEANKGYWQKGVEYIGNMWSQYKEGEKIQTQERVEKRLASMGVYQPDQHVLGAVTQAMRSGTGSAAGMEIDLSSGGHATGSVGGILALTGADPSSKVTLDGTLSKRFGGLARNIAGISRLTASQQNDSDAVVRQIGDYMHSGETYTMSSSGKRVGAKQYYQTVGKDIQTHLTNLLTNTGDQVNSRRMLTSRIGSLLEGTAYEKEFAKDRLEGKHGSQMFLAITKTMKGLGHDKFDLAAAVKYMASKSSTGVAQSLESDVSNTIANITRGSNTSGREKVAKIMEEKITSNVEMQLEEVRLNVGNIPSEEAIAPSLAKHSKVLARMSPGKWGSYLENTLPAQLRGYFDIGGSKTGAITEKALQKYKLEAEQEVHKDQGRLITGTKAARTAIYYSPTFQSMAMMRSSMTESEKIYRDELSAAETDDEKQAIAAAHKSSYASRKSHLQELGQQLISKAGTNTAQREVAQAVAKNLMSADPEVVKKAIKQADIPTAGKMAAKKRRRPRGRQVMYGSGTGAADKFNTRLTQMLNKTAKTLGEVSKAMGILQGKMKPGT